MFSFVPNISDALTKQLSKEEKIECQEKLWRSRHGTVSFTQSLCVTPVSRTSQQSELLHSIHVVPNDFGQHGHSEKSPGCASLRNPRVTIAHRCYVCDDPFCPNISLLNRNQLFHLQSGKKQTSWKRDELFHNNALPSSCLTQGSERGSRRETHDVFYDGSIPQHKVLASDKRESPSFFSPDKSEIRKVEQTPSRTFQKSGKSPLTIRKQLFSEQHSENRTRNISPRTVGFRHYANCDSFDNSDTQTESSGFLSDHFERESNSRVASPCCCEGPYHRHTFENSKFSISNDFQTMAKYDYHGQSRPFETHISLDRSSHSSQSNLLHYSEKDNHKNICMTFWKPQLSFCQYKFGDKLVAYTSLWPSEASLRRTMAEVCHDTVLRRAVLEMCKIALRCGPVRLLKALLDLKLVNKDQVFEDGSGMLHLALIARNTEAVQFLCQIGISPKIRDKFGHTADQVCFSPQLRKLLPQKYQVSNSSQANRVGKSLIFSSVHDVESIFHLARSSKHFDELQKKLQTYEFNVNVNCDSKGEYLVHLATRGGLAQLPLLLTLVRVQGADIELCNNAGMTPLMIAAQNGDAVLCDVMLCVFGCNPNKPNPSSGSYALHYACANKCSEVVNVLLNRGADFNLENSEGRRPDDTVSSNESEEVFAILRSQRMQRSEYLSGLIERGEPFEAEVRYTDLCVVDGQGRTLIMVAAEHNRVEHLELLLAVEGSPIDAQHEKSGQTAMSIAARAGNMESVRVLLSRDANPGIPDLHGYLPLHYAVMNSHGDILETMIEFFPKTFTGLHLASKLAVNKAIHNRVKMAVQKRKEEILTPELYDCALTGDATRLFRVLEDGDSVNLKRDVAPLYLAVENGHLDVIRLLYERGGDITKCHPVTHATVLHAAAKMGHTEVVQFLIQFCRPVTPPVFTLLSKQKTKSSFSPFVNLNQSYYKELDINAVDGDGKTPLQLAAEKGYSSIVKLLLDHDATTALLGKQGELIKCPQYEGVRIMIEAYREQHTENIVKFILDRKGLNNLKQIWLPRFDHNLRDKQGNTPLMVACKTGRMEVVKFLLQSAVYSNKQKEDTTSEDSDTDSGVDRTSNKASSVNKQGEKNENSSCRDSQSSQCAMSVMLQPKKDVSFRPGNSRPHSAPLWNNPFSRKSPSWFTIEDLGKTAVAPQENDRTESEQEEFLKSLPDALTQPETESSASSSKYVMSKLMRDLTRPKGLQIYHDNKVCHVCAVNLQDGNTALHQVILGGDNPQLVQLVISEDPTVAHIQNFQGYSPLHTACKLSRKKTVKLLLTVPDIDIHCLTAEGQQAEDLCSSKAVKKLVTKARTENPPLETRGSQESPIPSQWSSSDQDDVATTVSLDKIRDKYRELKKGLHTSRLVS